MLLTDPWAGSGLGSDAWIRIEDPGHRGSAETLVSLHILSCLNMQRLPDLGSQDIIYLD